MNKWFNVIINIARGACMDIGKTITMSVQATSALNAAIAAERMVDATLEDGREYAHTKRVDFIPWGEAASMTGLAAA
jgi:hypothetical protein